ncbi:MAG: hypothetical protein IPJ10_04555 [Flavobacteriales bacterium]|nr:hypothetical protein [Flavobacteriales bacterium]
MRSVLTLRRFKYDALGQLTQAQFATVNAPVQDQNSTYLPPSYTPSTNYKLWNLTYDKNGNLQTLDRNGRGEGLAMDHSPTPMHSMAMATRPTTACYR